MTEPPSLSPGSVEGPRLYLLVFDGASSSVTQVRLAGPEPMVIGGDGADVPLRGEAGREARVQLTFDGDDVFAEACAWAPEGGREPVVVRVNGEALRAPRLLAAGDVLSVDTATLVFNRDALTPVKRGVVPLAELLRRLEEETERSLRYQRPLTVVAIAFGSSGLPTAASRLAAADAVVDALRLVDVVAWSHDHELLVLLPETADTARTPASRVVQAVLPFAAEARAGFASCPADGCDVDTLLRGARDAASTATVGTVAATADTNQARTIDDVTIVVADPAMKRLFAMVERLAVSDLPVLVCGETGVGKEVVAAALHAWSKRGRGKGRLRALNCAAVPEALLESELFGHEKGAFSGAFAAKPGLFELADEGTLFLDEVAELSPSAQAKLLRALETKTVSRVGGVHERALDVRVVAATNRPLEGEVARGAFRQDLYFRLCAATVFVPPLRDRRLDLPVLARTLLRDACERLGRPTPTLSSQSMLRLARHAWPGNVRELKNAMAYVAATCRGEVVEPDLLPERVTERVTDVPMSVPRPPSSPPSQPRSRPQPILSDAPVLSSVASDVLALRRKSGEFRNIYEEIRELERTRMLEALEAADGVRVRAAELIGMPLRTFVTKLREYELSPLSKRRRPPPSSSSPSS